MSTIEPQSTQSLDEWFPASASEESDWYAITYGNGKFVATANYGVDNRVMYSEDGITWTSTSAAAASNWKSVAYGNGKFVSVSANTTNKVMYSEDGINWTLTYGTEGERWYDITYGNGKFVAVSNKATNRVMYSEDAINWTASSATEQNSWYAITYGNGKFVAVSLNGTNRVMYSEDAINWTAASAAEQNYWYSVTYGNGKFVAVSGNGTKRVMYSEDGINWTSASAARQNDWQSITYGNGKFVAISTDNTNRVMYSEDGITWTSTSEAETNTWRDVTYGNGKFVAVSSDGTNRVMYAESVPPPSIEDVTLTAATKHGKDQKSGPFSAEFDGDADDVTYLWEAGDGDQIFNPYGRETDIKFANEGTTTVTCTLESDTADDSPVVVTQDVEVVAFSGAEGYTFAVQRGDTVYSCLGIDLKDKLQADDLMMLRRGDIDYKWTVKEHIDRPEWINNLDPSLSILHIQNLTEPFVPIAASRIIDKDGNQYQTTPAGYMTIPADGNDWYVSGVTPRMSPNQKGANANWDFGPHTDTSKMKSFMRFLQSATSFNGDVSYLDTSSAGDFFEMFNWCESFNHPSIKKFMFAAHPDPDSLSKPGCKKMFFNAKSFDQDISHWDTSEVYDMESMFYGAEAFNQNISNWDTSSVSNMKSMFNNAYAFNQDLSQWCVSSITSASSYAYFAGNSPIDGTNKMPVWGTCPRGEDQA